MGIEELPTLAEYVAQTGRRTPLLANDSYDRMTLRQRRRLWAYAESHDDALIPAIATWRARQLGLSQRRFAKLSNVRRHPWFNAQELVRLARALDLPQESRPHLVDLAEQMRSTPAPCSPWA